MALKLHFFYLKLFFFALTTLVFENIPVAR